MGNNRQVGATRCAFACLLTLACASARPGPGAEIATGHLLGDAVAAADGATPIVEDREVLLLSADMRAFLDRHVARKADAMSRLRQLCRAILDVDGFGLTYDETTRTASETFRARRGNCLSFSSMFVAMARGVGLKAHYQEVDSPPDWSLQKDALVLNRHVNVVVDLGRRGDYVVDFNLDDFRASYERRRVSDERALAHHYNNVAVERMRDGDRAAALLHFRRAIEHDPSFAPAWTNLGILHLRDGSAAYAEAAHLRALAADRRNLVAMSNLASLYEQAGDQGRAEWYRRRVAKHRNGNPYYRFHLAREAIRARDYDAAIKHLKYAVSRKRTEDRFYFYLGLSHLGRGDQRAARHWFSRAREMAASDALKRRYESKMETARVRDRR
jgi:Flp pilus assembly protein TadD